MGEISRLEGKRVLIVDDELDVLETLQDILSMCEVSTCTNFVDAEKQLKSGEFDIAILDIMGVDGYKLLDIATKRNINAVMLTAHAFSIDDTVKSFKGGAALYIPKEKMSEIVTFLEDMLAAKEQGKSTWSRWLERLGSYYDEKFEKAWRNKDKEFWKTFPYV